eukprot:tig00020782_g13705.t1
MPELPKPAFTLPCALLIFQRLAFHASLYYDEYQDDEVENLDDKQVEPELLTEAVDVLLARSGRAVLQLTNFRGSLSAVSSSLMDLVAGVLRRRPDRTVDVRPAPSLLGLPDALLLRILRLACLPKYGSSDSLAPCATQWEEKLRAKSPEPQQQLADLKQLCRLRRVCRAIRRVLEAPGAAPRGRLELFFDEAPTSEQVEAVLRRACESAARTGGIEELDVVLNKEVCTGSGALDATP